MSSSGTAVNGSLPKVGQGSLTDQTTRALLDAILSKQFPDNRLPAEPELAERLNVSRTTIRAALQSLERLGMLSRAPGRGTVIRPHVGAESIVLQRLIGFRSMLAEQHRDVVVDGSYALQDHATPNAAHELRIAMDTPVIATDKTFFADGVPAIQIRDQIPLAYVDEEAQRTLREGQSFTYTDSIFEFSRTWPGREIDHAVVEVAARTMPVDDAIQLSLAPGTPYILLIETHYTAAGEPVAYSEIHVDDAYVRFHIVRHH